MTKSTAQITANIHQRVLNSLKQDKRTSSKPKKMHSTGNFFMTPRKKTLAARHDAEKSDAWIIPFSIFNWIATVCAVSRLIGNPQCNTPECLNWGFLAAIAANCYIQLSYEQENRFCFAMHLVVLLIWTRTTTVKQILLVFILCNYIIMKLLFLALIKSSLFFKKRQLNAKYFKTIYYFWFLTITIVMCINCCQKNFKMYKNQALFWLLFCDNWMHQLLFLKETRIIARKLLHTCSNSVQQAFHLFLCIAANPTNTEE